VLLCRSFLPVCWGRFLSKLCAWSVPVYSLGEWSVLAAIVTFVSLVLLEFAFVQSSFSFFVEATLSCAAHLGSWDKPFTWSGGVCCPGKGGCLRHTHVHWHASVCLGQQTLPMLTLSDGHHWALVCTTTLSGGWPPLVTCLDAVLCLTAGMIDISVTFVD
jgi:hypothetical protein